MELSDIGLHFIVGLSGPILSDLDKKILEELRPAGILLLKRNFLQNAPYHEWLQALSLLERAVKEYTGREKVIISIDHEGGKVHRTPSPITHFSEARAYADKASAVAKAMAIELRSLGINVSWSPVCDINSNPENPIIGNRAFGVDPKNVGTCASQFSRALLENGICACMKHFPGHGDTTKDSHKELPTLTLTLDELKQRELIPFIRLINEGVPLLMTSHILFPKIDADNPATLSKTILKDILRDTLGFGGIIVTDDLDMNAVSHRSSGDLVTTAAEAGCELFIVARYPDGSSDKPLEMGKALLSKAQRDAEFHKLLCETQEKITYFITHALGNSKVMELPSTIFDSHKELARIL